jgi:hypothetical protein
LFHILLTLILYFITIILNSIVAYDCYGRDLLVGPMGSPMAPSYANLFMGQLEHKMLNDVPGGLIPLEWIRSLQYGHMELINKRISYNILTTSIPLLSSKLNTLTNKLIFLILVYTINNPNKLGSDLFESTK